MASFVLSFSPLDAFDEIWDLIESVSEGFLTYSFMILLLFFCCCCCCCCCFSALETVNGGHIGRSLCKQMKIAIDKDHSDIKLVLFHHRFLTIFLGCLMCLRPPEAIIKGSLKFEKRKTKQTKKNQQKSSSESDIVPL